MAAGCFDFRVAPLRPASVRLEDPRVLDAIRRELLIVMAEEQPSLITDTYQNITSTKSEDGGESAPKGTTA